MANWVLAALLPVLLFWAYCLIDFANTPEPEIRTLPRQTWLAIHILGSVVGGVAWWLLGRPADPKSGIDRPRTAALDGEARRAPSRH